MARYTYVDGNNNTYEIDRDRLSYKPVRAANSNTGMYSGGEPQTIALAADQFAALETLLRSFVGDTQHAITDRSKGCGTLVDGDARHLRAMNSPHKLELERELAALLR
jgi:hypothetical protein